MMLRTSSTPVLGSLLSSFLDSPNKDFDNRHPSSTDLNHSKLSFSHGGDLNFNSLSRNSSPASHSVLGFSELDRETVSFGQGGFRRTQSAGNLEGLAGASSDMDDVCNSSQVSRSSRRPSSNFKMLQTIPSFSLYNGGGYEYEEGYEQEDLDKEGFGDGDGELKRSVTIGDNIMDIGSGEFNFAKKDMGLIVEEEEGVRQFQNLGFAEESDHDNRPMYLARGLGIDVGGANGRGGGDGDFSLAGSADDGQDGTNVEAYYKKMAEENPCSALFLGNYAQFLYQSKGDLQGAEQYYSRAILSNPGDGEILSQYAKLVWELHQDQERATCYFERAVQAAPEDSHVLAAYASFLWDTEDDEQEDNAPQNPVQAPLLHERAMATATA